LVRPFWPASPPFSCQQGRHSRSSPSTPLRAGRPLSAQGRPAITFENTVADLQSRDARVRARAVDLLKAAAYTEAALPLAPLVTDPVDDIQLSVIGAELNIFLAQKVTPKKRVAFVVERRGNIAAESIFNAGPSVVAPERVPLAVAVQLAAGALDRTARVAYEAMFAFGALAPEVAPADRPALLQRSAANLAGILGSPDPTIRISALRVIGRVFAWQPGDGPIDERLGDAVVASLNAHEPPVRETAMWALGAMKYDRSVEGLSELVTFYRKGPLAERAFDAIARIGHSANMPQFVEKLNGKDKTLKMMAIEGIARTGERERFAGIDAVLKQEKHEAILLAGHFANVKLNDGTVTAIVDALERSELRVQALQYLFELVPGRVATFAPLVRTQKGVRLDIVDALGASGDAAALPIVQPLSGDADADVALAARRAVARLTK
jgi:HEAT repeat protein